MVRHAVTDIDFRHRRGPTGISAGTDNVGAVRRS